MDKRENKNGQIGIFVVISSILVFTFVYLIFFANNFSIYQEKEEGEIIDLKNAKDSLEICFREESENLIRYIIVQGGHYTIPEYPLIYDLSNYNSSVFLPYFIYNNNLLITSRKDIEDQISIGILNEVLPICYGSLDSFNFNYTIEDKWDVETDIINDRVKVKVHFPVVISQGELSKIIEKYNFELSSPILEFNEFANKITKEQYDLGNDICLSCIYNEISDRGYDFSFLKVEGEDSYSVIYSFGKEDYTYSFAHQFIVYEKSKRIVEDLDKILMGVDEVLEYDLVLYEDNLKLSDDTPLFDIEQNGSIRFAPSIADVGEHNVTIFYETQKGVKGKELFEIEVIR